MITDSIVTILEDEQLVQVGLTQDSVGNIYWTKKDGIYFINESDGLPTQLLSHCENRMYQRMSMSPNGNKMILVKIRNIQSDQDLRQINVTSQLYEYDFISNSLSPLNYTFID